MVFTSQTRCPYVRINPRRAREREIDQPSSSNVLKSSTSNGHSFDPWCLSGWLSVPSFEGVWVASVQREIDGLVVPDESHPDDKPTRSQTGLEKIG
jgi:hypothetical protein